MKGWAFKSPGGLCRKPLSSSYFTCVIRRRGPLSGSWGNLGQLRCQARRALGASRYESTQEAPTDAFGNPGEQDRACLECSPQASEDPVSRDSRAPTACRSMARTPERWVPT